MPNASDINNSIKDVRAMVETKGNEANTRLDAVNNNLNQILSAVKNVETAVKDVNATLKTGFDQVVKLLEYADLALYQNDLQNDTIICELEKIARNTCEILNEEHLQTGLQTNMNRNIALLVAIAAASHAEAALALQREQSLKDQIEKCCPPAPPEPVCRYTPCPTPKPLGPPPQIDRPSTNQGGGIN